MTHTSARPASAARPALLTLAAALLTACGDASGPDLVTYGIRLNGATTQHGAVMLNVRSVPGDAVFTPAPGLVAHARRTADGQAFLVLVAGDLTRAPLVTFQMPRSSTQLGNVVELANTDGAIVSTGTPTVVFTPQ